MRYNAIPGPVSIEHYANVSCKCPSARILFLIEQPVVSQLSMTWISLAAWSLKAQSLDVNGVESVGSLSANECASDRWLDCK